MRFVLVGPSYPHRGGIAQYTTSLFNALSVQHQARIFSFIRQYPKFLFPGRTQQDTSGSPFKAPSTALIDSVNPRTWLQTSRRILEFEPDAVIFQWWQPFFGLVYGYIMDRLSQKPEIRCLLLCHNIEGHERLRFPLSENVEQWLIRRAFLRAHGFLVHAESLIGRVHQISPGKEVRKVYHPLYDFYSDWDSVQPVERGSRPRLLFFGKVRRYKGLEVLIEALSIVRSQMDFELVIAGEFYLDAEPFRRQVEKLGLERSVTWKNHYVANEEVPGLFKSTDLVVLPYLRATQSGVVPVAYQFEVPVIASNVGGLAEVIRDGETGFLVPPGDPNAFARRILEFFQDGKSERFRENIRKFRKILSWDQVVETILELTRSLKA